MSRAVRVFISYSRADTDRATQLSEALRAVSEGSVVVLQDVLIPASHRWAETILAWIERADIVAVLISKNSIAAPWVHYELAIARQLGHTVVPIVLDDSDPESLPATRGIMALTRDSTPEDWANAVLAQTTKVSAPPPSTERNGKGNPFAGYYPYSEELSLYGREVETNDICHDVEVAMGAGGGCVLALSGTSGVGKTSLVLSSLLPILRTRHKDWRFTRWDTVTESVAVNEREKPQVTVIDSIESHLDAGIQFGRLRRNQLWLVAIRDSHVHRLRAALPRNADLRVHTIGPLTTDQRIRVIQFASIDYGGGVVSYELANDIAVLFDKLPLSFFSQFLRESWMRTPRQSFEDELIVKLKSMDKGQLLTELARTTISRHGIDLHSASTKRAIWNLITCDGDGLPTLRSVIDRDGVPSRLNRQLSKLVDARVVREADGGVQLVHQSIATEVPELRAYLASRRRYLLWLGWIESRALRWRRSGDLKDLVTLVPVAIPLWAAFWTSWHLTRHQRQYLRRVAAVQASSMAAAVVLISALTYFGASLFQARYLLELEELATAGATAALEEACVPTATQATLEKCRMELNKLAGRLPIIQDRIAELESIGAGRTPEEDWRLSTLRGVAEGIERVTDGDGLVGDVDTWAKRRGDADRLLASRSINVAKFQEWLGRLPHLEHARIPSDLVPVKLEGDVYLFENTAVHVNPPDPIGYIFVPAGEVEDPCGTGTILVPSFLISRMAQTFESHGTSDPPGGSLPSVQQMARLLSTSSARRLLSTPSLDGVTEATLTKARDCPRLWKGGQRASSFHVGVWTDVAVEAGAVDSTHLDFFRPDGPRTDIAARVVHNTGP